MLSSDDSFGWSATSDGTMSGSEEDNVSQASSVVERKLLKKQLREKLRETGQESIIMRNGFLDTSSSEILGSEVKKKKKKKEIKTEEADTFMESSEGIVRNRSIKTEQDVVSPKSKKKKKKIKSEQEETNTDEESSSQNYVKAKNFEKQTPQSENGIKQEDDVYTLTKKKRKKQKEQTAAEVSVCDNSFSEPIIKQEDKYKLPTRKKNKKLKTQQEFGKQIEGEATVCDDSFSEHIIKREDNHSSPTQKKNKKRKTREVEKPVDGEVSVCEDSFSDNIIKREDKHNSLTKKKSKKLKTQEVEKPVDGEVSVCEDSFSDNIIKREDKHNSPTKKKSKKRKAQEEVEKSANERQAQDESFSVPPKSKRRKKDKEPINEMQLIADNKLDPRHIKIAKANGKLDESIASKSFNNSNKKNSVSLSDNDNIDVLKEKVKARLQDDCNFDETSGKYTEIRRRKESSSSSTVVLSPKQKKESYSGNGSERRHSVPATIPTSHRPSSSSDSDLSTAQTQDKVNIKRKSESSQGGRKMEYEKPKKTHVRLSDKIQFEGTNDIIMRNTSSSSDSEDDISKVNKPSVSVTSPTDHTSQRISFSEKIRFEDDSDDAFNTEKGNTSPNKNAKTPLTRFIEKNPQLKNIKWNTVEGAIDSDDEIWVLQCPKDCEVSKLQGMDIVVDTKTKIKIEGQAYDGVLEEGTHRLAILTASVGRNKFEIKNVKPKGTVRFRKRIPKVHMTEAAPVPAWRDAFIPLPDTKRRHPLFGHDYKKFIKLPSAVAERLHHPPRRFISKHKHTKREQTPDQHAHEELTQEDVVIKKKKKKKHKLSGTGTSEMMTKKLKRDPDEVWDSEKAIEKSLFNF